MTDIRKETDSLGEVDVPAGKLWGAQTQRSLEHFSIGKDLIPHEMITAYAILKKAAANANLAGKRLDQKRHHLIVQVCDEILTGRHLSPVIGYGKASKIAHYAMDNDLTLKQAALKLGFVTEAEFDRVVDPKKMVTPYVATAAA
jgi:fumarate hydratase class II